MTSPLALLGGTPAVHAARTALRLAARRRQDRREGRGASSAPRSRSTTGPGSSPNWRTPCADYFGVRHAVLTSSGTAALLRPVRGLPASGRGTRSSSPPTRSTRPSPPAAPGRGPGAGRLRPERQPRPRRRRPQDHPAYAGHRGHAHVGRSRRHDRAKGTGGFARAARCSKTAPTPTGQAAGRRRPGPLGDGVGVLHERPQAAVGRRGRLPSHRQRRDLLPRPAPRPVQQALPERDPGQTTSCAPTPSPAWA